MQQESIAVPATKPNLIIILMFLAGLLWSLSLDERFKWVAAGIALFLFGMYFLEQGFKNAATPELRHKISQSTNNLAKSIFCGFALTLICQSSSLVIVLTISFLVAGILPLRSALGLILGTNLGATGGAWLIAGLGVKVDLAAYALPVLLPGILLISVRQWRRQDLGFILSGLGFAFLGIDYLKDGFETLQIDQLLSALPVSGWQSVLLFTGIGVLVTVLVQSSHAALLLCIAALASGQMSYEDALAFTIGSNVGTTFTSLLASLSGGLDAKRLAFSHIAFNIFTAVVFLLCFSWTVALNNQLASMIGISVNDLPIYLALYHSLFNFVGLVLLGTSLRYFQNFIEWCLPEPEPVDERVHALFLKESDRQHPQRACLALTREVEHLYSQILEIISRGFVGVSRDTMLHVDDVTVLTRNPYRFTESIQKMYRKRVKLLYGQILTYAANCKNEMNSNQVECVHKLVSMARAMMEIVRMLRHLQGNFNSAVEEGNSQQIDFHNQLQVRLMNMQRQTQYLQCLTQMSDIKDEVLREKNRIRRETKEDRDYLEKLICESELDPMSAGSLMNDCQMVRAIEQTFLKISLEWFEDNSFFDEMNEDIVRQNQASDYLTKPQLSVVECAKS